MTTTAPRTTPAGTLLDQLMPAFDHHEVHAAWIDASAERVWAEIRAVSLRDMVLAGALLTIRALPARLLRGRALPARQPLPFVETALRGGFTQLGEQPPTELVVGTIGRFWKLRGEASVPIDGADAFREFSDPGWAKAAMNFRITAERNGARLITETRILATDAAARRAFARYWRLIHLGSALIRRDLLRAIKRRAERT